MRKPWLPFLWLILFAATTFAQEVDVREETLPNGMRLLMVERHESPSIASGWVARVGSVNERPGITGISHLFEHLMFKGTKTIGTRDYEADKRIREQQDAIYEQIEQEYRKLRKMRRQGQITGSILDPANQTPRLKELRAQLEQLFEKERELIVKDELDQIYTREGASGLNAGTGEDHTLYFVTIPANKLELWFWLESDRLVNPVFREFYAERNVVREERRLRVESTPTGRLDEIFDTMFWQSSPYSWPVIGWASDVEAITRQHAEEYFSIYYAPNNITAVLVGDFDSDQALELAHKYFGRIPRGEKEPPEVITEEIVQDGEKRFHASADTNPQVGIRYHAVPFNHMDEFPLRVAAAILNGRTGRLYKSLVEEKEVAIGQPSATVRTLMYEGYFELGAQVKEGVDPAQVEAALLAEIERLRQEPVGERELQK
ncbi:MAG TPA: pitrilysin family protein, partial [Acidobacteriota bacterium]|nr:pitrilysin family protein [Acidobacteriota bacterium]